MSRVSFLLFMLLYSITRDAYLFVTMHFIFIYIYLNMAVYVIMCDACGMQYAGQTNNIRSHMNGHISDNRRFLNGDFSKSKYFISLQSFKIS